MNESNVIEFDTSYLNAPSPIQIDLSISDVRSTRAAQVLAKDKTISIEQLERVTLLQKTTKTSVCEALVNAGYINEDQLAQKLALKMHLTVVNLYSTPSLLEYALVLPEKFSRTLQAIVIDQVNDTFLVAVADPFDTSISNDLANVLGRDVELTVAPVKTLLKVIERTFTSGFDAYKAATFETGFSVATTDWNAPLKVVKDSSTSSSTDHINEINSAARKLERDTETDVQNFDVTDSVDSAPVNQLIENIFKQAIESGASDIHIESKIDKLSVRFRVDGELGQSISAEKKIANALVQALKISSNLDITEKRLPQDGRFAKKVGTQSLDIRISTMPSQHGESVVMRLLRPAASVVSISSLGMPPEIEDRVRTLLRKKSGSLIVTGPTGSGKTTTLYAAMATLDAEKQKIVTVEDPVEYLMPNITQTQVNSKIGLSFERVLRSTLRQDPDVIMIGEIRDPQTAEISLQAAMTGHLVLTTLHTNDAPSLSTRLQNMGIQSFMLSSSIKVVIAQRLVRMNCRSCAKPLVLSKKDLDCLKDALDVNSNFDEDNLRQGVGCPVCNNTGYAGRIGVYEMLDIDSELEQLIASNDNAAFLNVANQKMDGKRIFNHGAQLVANGITSFEEILKLND